MIIQRFDSLYFCHINLLEEKIMGCSDSNTISPSEVNQASRSKKKKANYDPDLQSEYQIPIDYAEDIDRKQISRQSKPKKIKSKKGKSPQVNEQRQRNDKENVTKVKKARELKQKPQHEKFISDIVQKSKIKPPQWPHVEHPLAGQGKPVVEYSNSMKKGVILGNDTVNKQNNQWNKSITEDRRQQPSNILMGQSYISVNEPEKSPSKMKQIEDRLNAVRNGKQKRHSKQFELYQSNKTMYL